jgi:mannose/fructose/N-acetylgalactosamine-specific phosphotransferase system component IIB
VSLRLVRIDDRLIHGQVVAGWLRALGAQRIVIVDDAAARDEFLREVLTLAAPQGVPVEVAPASPTP